MKTKAFIPLILGLCVGLVAVKFLVDSLQRAQGSTTDRGAKTPLVLAKQDIERFEEITAEMLEVVETTDVSLVPAAERITKMEDVAGRVTAKTIPQRSPILLSMLAPEGTRPGLYGMIKPGFRAVSVKIDEVTGVAYQLKPGDWVDVIVVMDVHTGSRTRRKETVAEVILQHIQVAAIGQTTTEQPGESGQKVKPAKSATLLVTEEDVPKLHLAATRGRLTLAMRGDDDQATGKVAVARGSEVFYSGRGDLGPLPRPSGSSPDGSPGFLGSFLAHAATPAPMTPDIEPQAEPEPPHGVTIYHDSLRGVQVEQVVFEHGRSRTIVGVSEGPINRLHSATRKDDRVSMPSARRESAPPDRVETVSPVSESDSDFQEAE